MCEGRDNRFTVQPDLYCVQKTKVIHHGCSEQEGIASSPSLLISPTQPPWWAASWGCRRRRPRPIGPSLFILHRPPEKGRSSDPLLPKPSRLRVPPVLHDGCRRGGEGDVIEVPFGRRVAEEGRGQEDGIEGSCESCWSFWGVGVGQIPDDG